MTSREYYKATKGVDADEKGSSLIRMSDVLDFAQEYHDNEQAMIRHPAETCTLCEGKGKIGRRQSECEWCKGTGTAASTQVIKLKDEDEIVWPA